MRSGVREIDALGEQFNRRGEAAFAYNNKHMAQEKIHGVSVSAEMIEAWAAEVEAGYPVEQLRKRGRKSLGDGVSEVVPVRLD